MEEKKEKLELTEAAKRLRNKKHNEWQRKNKDKVREYNIRWLNKKAAELEAEAEAEKED